MEALRDFPDRAAIVCDAGSTGSRVFGFFISRNDTGTLKVAVERFGRTEIGLSWFATNGLFKNASESLLPLLREGINRLGPSVPIHVLATGGVRSLPRSIRQKLMEFLKSDLRSSLGDSHQGIFDLQMVEGVDEALFGLLATNYLVGKNSLDEIASPLREPYGVLDLGGSSLEIALVGNDKTIGTSDDLLISLKSFGLNKLREMAGDQGALPRECEFGMGTGIECRRVITSMIHKSEHFQELKRHVQLQLGSRFVGISAFVYALDFASWLLKLKTPLVESSFVAEYPTPSVDAIRIACDMICKLPYLEALFRQHRFTSAREAPTRCFDVCAIAEILGELFPGDGSQAHVVFLADMDGHELEWTLGFYLSTYAKALTDLGADISTEDPLVERDEL